MPDVRLRAVVDGDSAGLIRLIAAVFAEYPGCVLDVDREEPELRLEVEPAWADGPANRKRTACRIVPQLGKSLVPVVQVVAV